MTKQCESCVVPVGNDGQQENSVLLHAERLHAEHLEPASNAGTGASNLLDEISKRESRQRNFAEVRRSKR